MIYWALGPFVRSFILPVDPGDICPALTLSPVPTPIKPTPALTVHPLSLSTPPEHKFTGDRSAHGVPAAALAPATMDWPL
jgi:hypothetical protein